MNGKQNEVKFTDVVLTAIKGTYTYVMHLYQTFFIGNKMQVN